MLSGYGLPASGSVTVGVLAEVVQPSPAVSIVTYQLLSPLGSGGGSLRPACAPQGLAARVLGGDRQALFPWAEELSLQGPRLPPPGLRPWASVGPPCCVCCG